MRTEEELLEQFKNAKIDSYKVKTEINFNNTIQLMTIEDLIKFSCKHNIDTVFYNYIFTDDEALSITEDTLSDLRLGEDTFSILKDKFDEYNNSLLNLDYTKPIYLNVYCIYDGVVFFVEEEDYWFEEQGFNTPKVAGLELVTKHFEDIVAEKENKKKIINERLDRLHEYILNDEEFHRCSNIEARRMYAIKMFKDNPNNQELFHRDSGGLYGISISTFIENIWREYKYSLKK